jgi:hypothetical protein
MYKFWLLKEFVDAMRKAGDGRRGTGWIQRYRPRRWECPFDTQINLEPAVSQ